jgi:protein involved in polysaccharide export with SLBB domain
MKSIYSIVCLLFFSVFLGIAAEEDKDIPKLKKGEEYQLSIRGVPEDERRVFEGLYRIDAKGDITLPLAGRIQVDGLTVEEARKTIEKALKDRGIFKQPKIRIDMPGHPQRPKGDANQNG